MRVKSSHSSIAKAELVSKIDLTTNLCVIARFEEATTGLEVVTLLLIKERHVAEVRIRSRVTNNL